MKAMILAAGLGNRLKPLTDATPKALIEIGGVPMLEIVIKRLAKAGVVSIIINLHHLGDRIRAFLKAKRNFGVYIEFSEEETLLETGGGLKAAADFFDDDQPFFLHNADVLTDIDLNAMMRFHRQTGALATLAVEERPSSRCLLFDKDGRLRGRASSGGVVQWAGEPAPEAERLAFSGVHVVSPRLLPLLTETGAFSITQPYLRLAAAGELIQAFRCDGCFWQDIGDAAKLTEARRRAKERGLPL